MTDHDAFLEAIIEQPDADFPRLHYADWLDERGDPRGEFIRVQCELAAHPKHHTAETGCPLRRREQELLSTHGAIWANPIVSAAPLVYPLSWQWSRGFISHITLSHDAFLVHATVLFLAAPIEAVTLSDKHPDHPYPRDNNPQPNYPGWFGIIANIGSRLAQDDLDSAIWDCLEGRTSGRWKWYDTATEANADLSVACVKMGRQRAAKLKKDMVKQ